MKPKHWKHLGVALVVITAILMIALVFDLQAQRMARVTHGMLWVNNELTCEENNLCEGFENVRNGHCCADCWTTDPDC